MTDRPRKVRRQLKPKHQKVKQGYGTVWLSCRPEKNRDVYNLSLHIEYLLLRHDCVVVPGLGAFINVRHAASRDEATGMWHPMTREVRFNSALSHDDGLLASSYARKNEVSFKEGREMLRREIRELLEMLDSDGEVTLGQLGILRRTEDTVTFIPRLSATQWAALMGYAAAPVIKVSVKKQTEEKESPAIHTDSSARENSAAPDNRAEVQNGRVFDTHRNYYIAVNKMFARTAACLMIAAIAVISLILPFGDRSREDQASVVPVEKIIRDTASRIASAVNERGDTTVARSADIDSVAESTPEPTKRFHAIVATFATSEEAELYISQNSGTGYILQVVTGRTKSRVSAMSSDNRAELHSEMAKGGFRERFSEAWIWEDTSVHSIR